MSELHDRIAGLSPVKRLLLEKLRVAGGRAPDGPIPRNADGTAPLSWEQRRLWFLHRLVPGGPAYTIPTAFRLRGALDADALVAAIRAVAGRHQALRLAFREVDGEPVQEAGPVDRIHIDRTDSNSVSGDADARIAAFFARGFDLTREPPFRAMLARTGEDEHVLAMALHHVAADGASAPVLLREMTALYAAAADGRDANLPDPPLQLPDFAAWQRSREVDTEAVAWWRDALAGAPHVLEVPADHPRPAAQSFAGSRVSFALPADVSRAVHARAASEEASPFTLLATAFAVVLHRATGEDDLLIGTAVANRDAPGADAAVGFFANTVPLRIRIDRGETVRALIHRMRTTVAEAQDHARVPFDRIVEAAGVRRDAGRPPLVQVMLSLDPAENEALQLPGIRAERIAADTGASPFDLTLSLADAREGVRGELQYRTDLYEPTTITRLVERFAAVLRAFADDPAVRIADLPRVTEAERRALVAAWGEADGAPAEGCVHALIEARARETPDALALALAWADQEVSYGELNRRANRIAHHLAARGICAEMRVGVLAARTPAMVAAYLGILKAGAAYVPLDPRNPPARLESMLRAAGAAALLVDRAHAGRLSSAGVAEIALESIPAAPGTSGDPALPVDPAQVACVVFTSGSTGGPKGVEIRHGAVVGLLHWLRDTLAPAERAAVLASSSTGFDVAIAELFGPLAWGGAVMLVDDVLAAPPRPVRTACMVPSVAGELLRADRLPAGVRTLMLGGEALPPRLAAELHRRLPGVHILNLYGPTECTVYATCAEIAPDAPQVTIGRPVTGARAYVLDERMRPCGIGEPGELWLGGAGLARGYAGRPALTAECFIPDPHGPPGSRMYRTLDRARLRGDGALEYRGRADAQVKVRGVRIEPGEVEAALLAHPAVREAAAAVHPIGDLPQLVAWAVPADGDLPPAPELRAFLRERLLEAMIPAAFVTVDGLPRTTSGKLDRRALPAPPETNAAIAREHVPPRDTTETAIAAAWRDVLGVDRVGIHDDFFELGGHSLLALRLLARVRETLHADLPVAALLQGPTVAQMARAVAGHASLIQPPVVVLQGQGAARPLFLVHAGGGHLMCYHTLAQLLAPDQPLYGLQARGLDDGLPPLQGVDAMAAHYLEGVRRAQPEGPYRLGGWSYGGMVAWEMARRIRADGGEVELLAMIDTQRPEPRATPGLALDHAAVLRRVLTDLFGWSGTASVTIEGLRRMDPDAQVAFTARRLGPRILPAERVAEVAALTRVRMANHNATVDYEPRPYAGRLTYFRSRGSAALMDADETLRYWGRMADAVGLHEVAGNHGTLLQHPHAATLADAIRGVIARLDTRE